MGATWKERIFLILYSGILVLLFLMSSTNLIIKEKKKEIYRVSVIVEDSRDDFYINLKKGMEQAALKHNVDLNFITLYERNHSGQQADILERELEMGTQAVILTPVDAKKTAAALDEMTIDVPLVILNNNEPEGNKIAAHISVDYFKAGEKLARGALEDLNSEKEKNSSIYLFTEGLQYGSNARMYDGILSVMKTEEKQAFLIEKAFRNRYREVLETRIKEEQNAVILALDTETLTELAEIIDEDPEKFSNIKLYGPGTTLKLLRYLERDRIRGVLAQDSYAAGYLSIERAVSAMEHKGSKECLALDSFFLRKEDIMKKEYEKMLYPID